jgi:nucleotide-binding universal stress UspA family protein
MERIARDDLNAFLAARPDHGFPASRRVRVGNPAREIAAEAVACDADLLVLGTHGRSGSSRFLLGSVAEASVRMTRGNVLVLPAGRPVVPTAPRADHAVADAVAH